MEKHCSLLTSLDVQRTILGKRYDVLREDASL